MNADSSFYQDRGLRDHLLEMPAVRPKRKVQKQSSACEPTSFSLARSCVGLSLEAPLTATFEARLDMAPSKEMIDGHRILGHPLMPATMFAEIAMEAAAHVIKALGAGNAVPTLEVHNLQMFSSIFPKDSPSEKQRLEIKVVGSPLDSDGATVQFFTRDLAGDDSSAHQHGSCTVMVSNMTSIETEWMRLKPLILERAEGIRRSAESRLNKPMIYRQFEMIVAYGDAYRGMETVYMNEAGNEGVSEVRLQKDAPIGNFCCSPTLLESLGQLSGFIANVGLAESGMVFMADRIGKIVATPALSEIDSSAKLLSWARMELKDGTATGDVYFVDEHGKFLGGMQNVVFKQLRRTALQRLVSMGASAAAARVKPAEVKKKGQLANSDSAVWLPSAAEEEEPPAECIGLAGPSYVEDSPTPLFILPDGSGSAGCFASALSQHWRISVLGLNSPFATNASLDSWTGGIGQLSMAYFHKIISVQPDGPYVIAGYSLGAMCAVEVSRLLASTGRNVDRLILLECPALHNSTLPPLPPGSLEMILAKIQSPVARKHFAQAAQAVPGHRFNFDWPNPAKVTVINASDDSMTPSLMTSRRSDWKSVFKIGEVEVLIVEGDHQTFLKNALNAVSVLLQT